MSTTLVEVTLVDVNPKMIAAWRATFAAHPEVKVLAGSILDQAVSAWVTPTNSKGFMDGGLDGVLKRHFGPPIEKAVQAQIKAHHKGAMPIGHATCVETGSKSPRYLISTPTMSFSSEDVSDTLNVALACSAALQAVHMQNARVPGSITSVALPGLGANTGRVPVEICSDLMWTAYDLFRKHAFSDFNEMRAALEEELGDLGSTAGKTSAAVGAAAGVGAGAGAVASKPATSQAKAATQDFDDHDGDDDDDDDDDEHDKDDEHEDFDDH